MDSLRIILLIIGVLVVVAIIVIDRMRKENLKAAFHHDDDPLLNDENDPLFAKRADPIDEEDLQELKQGYDKHSDETDNSIDTEIEDHSDSDKHQNNQAEAPKEGVNREEAVIEPKVMMLAIVSKKDASINGKQLRDLMEQNDFSYQDGGIFQRLYKDSPVLSVANISESGKFDLDNLDDFKTKGIWIYIQLPCVIDGVEAVDELVIVAEKISTAIDGNIYNQQKKRLDDDFIESMKQIAANYAAVS